MLGTSEHMHPSAKGLDERSGPECLALLLEGQIAALQAIRPAIGAIEAGADLMAECLTKGGRLIYAGAGSSALMAMADALELPGTFGVPTASVRVCMAGGMPGAQDGMPGHTEDDADAAHSDAAVLTDKDCVICVAASGSTPYPLAFRDAAIKAGARVIALANVADAPLFDGADVAICLPTPPEVIAGSTRLGAGTAQKAALNMMSSLMGIRLGHVHDGLMVNVVADNIKLRGRAARIVAHIAGCDTDKALRHLEVAGGKVKTAVLLALGAPGVDAANQILREAEGVLRTAIPALQSRAG